MAVTYPKHAKALKGALADLGVAEEPDGSNTGRRVREYQASTWLGGTGWPWCVAFAIFHALKAGFKLPYLGAGAYKFLDWARSVGWAVPAGAAVPGDFVVFNIGAGHLAVLQKKVKDGRVKTVDGNVDNAVELRDRPLSQVRGFVHLPEKPVKVKTPRPPVFEVVTAADGQKTIYVSGARAIGRNLARFLRRHPAGVTIRRRRP